MKTQELYCVEQSGRDRGTPEGGYMLVAVLVLVSVAAIVVASALELTSSSSHSILAGENRSEEFLLNEQTFSLGVGWMRGNSTSLADPFSRNNFYSVFDRSSPSLGSNDTSSFGVPTKIKKQGSSQSAILTNTSALASGWFPSTVDTVTGTSFNPLTNFQSTAMGSKKIRVTLVDAVAVDPTKDFGDTDAGNPAPQTDFQPVYRIDSMDSLTSGSHLFGYFLGSLQYDYGVGFYGHNYFEMRQPCDSYISNNGAYSSSSKRANCSTGSNSEIRIHQTTSIYGTSRTNGAFNTTPPFGGKVCADFTSGCPNPGATCSGSSCQVAGLPSFSTWSTYCPTSQAGISPASGTTLTVAGNNPNQKCWASLTVGANKIVTLTSTQYPYFIDVLDIANNGRLNFAPSPSTGTITLYVRKFNNNDRFNGNQMFNSNNKPYQLRINYLGTNDLVLNGAATIHGFLVAPYAGVSVQGNHTYSGGIKALNLTFTGAGSVHYDESGDITTLKDVSYRLKGMTQRYR